MNNKQLDMLFMLEQASFIILALGIRVKLAVSADKSLITKREQIHFDFYVQVKILPPDGYTYLLWRVGSEWTSYCNQYS